MQIRIAAGSAGTAISVIGGGLTLAFPHQKWLGFPLIGIGILIFLFDVRIEHGHIESGERRLGRLSRNPTKRLIYILSDCRAWGSFPKTIKWIAAIGFIVWGSSILMLYIFPALPWPTTIRTDHPAATLVPRPDLAGTVQQIVAASKFTVAGRKIQLWGIDDSTRRGEHIRAVFDYLLPYRGVVKCYHKAGDRYQCYAGGHDLAVLALQHGFARPTSEAPREYRELGPASLRN